jgi:hypothetical protein
LQRDHMKPLTLVFQCSLVRNEEAGGDSPKNRKKIITRLDRISVKVQQDICIKDYRGLLP